ncbi:MAG TPA: SRPBCC domain-containing protein [Galbitalea sp.]|jgi:activator of HSP90 ATPase|nr:SRPBCC domain-containing protein [Galbitalea sp.]
MTYDFEQTATIPATPSAIYDAWMSSAEHTAMTGAGARVDPAIGGEFSAWDGYISGTTLELGPGRRIVQTWRTAEFATDDPDSIIEVTFEPVPAGTLLTLAHRNVPSGQRGYEDGGWESNYFEPMISYFRSRQM